ncbi:MAG: GNAT family N-acetyltransferase [bacterium]
MSFEIRRARADDVPRLHAIHHRATMSSYGRELIWLDAILADPATPLETVEWTIVAVDAAEALGYASVTGRHLENLFIDPTAQGRGVGAALLAEFEAQLRGVFDTATLRCLHANRNARRFYERHGYHVRETQTVVLHDHPLQAWLMAKSL